tara:strand:+ start:2090 stop:3010 length:921 start_codon:yes stop_codon:yes gene_type:complete
MSILNQKTIKSSIFIEGIGLHTGKLVKMKINPADPNTGVIFKRSDLKDNNIVVPGVFNVTNATFCTTISNSHGVKISTIEHLMGAFYGLGIDNVLIEIDNEEVPILDGSAKMFVKKIEEVGVSKSNSPIKVILINKKVKLQDGKKSICIEPNKTSLDIDFEIKYENQLIGTQRNIVSVYNSDLSEIYNSRTFCLYEDIEKLKEMNLAQGGSLDNAIVVKNEEILNSEGLRNKKEFVNHKILDCMGDIYMSGYKIIAKITCSQGGHKLTNDLLRLVFENSDNFSIIEIKEKTLSNHLINKIQLKSIA